MIQKDNYDRDYEEDPPNEDDVRDALAREEREWRKSEREWRK